MLGIGKASWHNPATTSDSPGLPWPGARLSFFAPADGERQQFLVLFELRPQFEAAREVLIIERADADGVAMIF